MHQFLEKERVPTYAKGRHSEETLGWTCKKYFVWGNYFQLSKRGQSLKNTYERIYSDISTNNPDLKLSLSDSEKKFCKHIDLKGKHGCKVPILLTLDLVELVGSEICSANLMHLLQKFWCNLPNGTEVWGLLSRSIVNNETEKAHGPHIKIFWTSGWHGWPWRFSRTRQRTSPILNVSTPRKNTATV